MSRGCRIGTIGSELSEHDELIRYDVLLIFDLMKSKLATFFVRAKAQGRLSAEADEESMAPVCISALQGAILLGKIIRDTRPLEAVHSEALMHLAHYVSRA